MKKLGSANKRQGKIELLCTPSNCYSIFLNQESRTYNGVEAWDCGFSSNLMTAHVSLWKFLESLQLEQSRVENIITKNTALQNPTSRKRKYMDLDNRLHALAVDIENKEPLEYLKSIALDISMCDCKKSRII